MTRMSVVGMAVLTGALLCAAAAGAQESPSGIAGVVKDSSGAVLPGVTVEASSPALIEKVRTVVTDSEGQFKIVDLRVGTYTVTFSLTGFSTFKREGIELSAGFTASVNAEMKVGALEETVTVTGQSPLVDTQNTRQRTTVSPKTLDELPSATKGLSALVVLTAGMVGAADVGGSAGPYGNQNFNAGGGGQNGNGGGSPTYGRGIHGKAGGRVLFDGLRINSWDAGSGTTSGYIVNSLSTQEMLAEIGGVSAESASPGIMMNSIPRDGGNRFSGSLHAVFNNESMQSDNITSDLQKRLLTAAPKYLLNRDFGGSLGGPIFRDKLWFFTAQRWWGLEQQLAGIYVNATQHTPFYTPDLTRPSVVDQPYRSHSLRLTWQASQKDKFTFYADPEQGHQNFQPDNPPKAPEAQAVMRYKPLLFQATWSSPRTNRLLLEAGFSTLDSTYAIYPPDGVLWTDPTITELSTGLIYGAENRGGSPQPVNQQRVSAQRASMSYITGSHAFKLGFQVIEGWHLQDNTPINNDDVAYTFSNQRPSSLTQYLDPVTRRMRLKADLGIYAQDQWTLRRMTINAGLRFDYFNSYVPEQHVPAGRFVVARDFAPIYHVPLWTDLNPRVGVAYDLFGTGRTAVKVSLSRYVSQTGTDVAVANNPIGANSVNNVNRTWNDNSFPAGDPRNGNYIPDCDLLNLQANLECGRASNLNFGSTIVNTTWDGSVLHGFGVRPYSWDFAAEVQHELRPGVSVSGGYYRAWFGNFTVTDNTLVAPSDFTTYCITAPTATAPNGYPLPGGGGYQMCGLADVSVAKFGQVSNLVRQASEFGNQIEVSNFYNASVNARVGTKLRAGGGVDTGQTVNDRCFVVDSPGELVLLAQSATSSGPCRIVRPWSSTLQIKGNLSYQLPLDMQVGMVYQNIAGPPILAQYTASNAEIAPSLGRNLASCGTAAVCNGTVGNIPLIVPNTQFEDRRNQFDFRLSKIFNLMKSTRLQANFDVYNMFNASSVLVINTTYATANSQWLKPTAILPARVLQVSANFTF